MSVRHQDVASFLFFVGLCAQSIGVYECFGFGTMFMLLGSELMVLGIVGVVK